MEAERRAGQAMTRLHVNILAATILHICQEFFFPLKFIFLSPFIYYLLLDKKFPLLYSSLEVFGKVKFV